MSKKDFQNGFAVGFASKGKAMQKIIKVDAEVLDIIELVEMEDNSSEIIGFFNTIEIDSYGEVE
jgi:hypothetical protein